jgi:uncharacterized membrane protein YjdF
VFKLFIKVISTIEILIFTIVFILIGLSSEQNGFLLAHITGAITFITIGGCLIYSFKKRKNITTWIFILCSVSLILMMLGYFFFLFEHISPYSHAGASLNFDMATIGTVLTIACLINLLENKV